ncbi:MAG: hypothetical protein J6W00_00655 [Lentisphaeria bacterium]|nr:hypothetical protein [Lentisphaeria bacterium]
MKKKCCMTLLFAVMFIAVSALSYDKSEYKVRPWEIIQGLQPHSQLLWDMSSGGIGMWQVSGKAKLSSANFTKLWGENVAKLDLPPGGSVTLNLTKPITIKSGEGDGLEIYLFGPLGSSPQIDFMLKDANGKTYRMLSSGTGSNWSVYRWWGLAAGLFPKGIKFPVTLTAVRFSRLTPRVKNDFLCFDRLGLYKETPVKMVDSSKMEVPFPVTKDGIMPIGMAKGAQNNAAVNGKKYTFSYNGNDAKITYSYTPVSGTLNDLTVTINGESFQPAVNGGIRAQVGDIKFMPGDKNIKATLLKEKFDGKRLVTSWKWQLKGAEYCFDLNFSIKGKSLAVEVKSDSTNGRAFDPGFTKGTPKPRLFALTYLNNRYDYPRFLATDKYFMSVFCDWYFTNAFQMWDSLPKRGLEKAEVKGNDSARLMSGTLYLNKTDGSYNPLYERFYITVSPELHDVMPHINNPPSRFLKESSTLVCATRCYPLQGNPKHADMELALWQKLCDYGVTDTYLRTHCGLMRTPIESENISYQLEGSYYNGGDATVKKFISGITKLTKRFGLYGDNRVVSAFNGKPYFDFAALGKLSNNTYRPGCGNVFAPKSSVQLEHQKIYVKQLLTKYPELNAQYMDELNNSPPWADTEADYLAPQAGKLTTVLRDYGLVALQQKELFNGPVWSEGCAAYFWAGLMDIDYAVSNDTKAQLPLIVDFKLTRLNHLSSFTGTDWPLMRDPKVKVDVMLANEIACGNIGHFALSGDSMMPWQGAPFRLKNYAPVLKSYFMIRQVQEYYAGKIADSIKYDINGKLMTASEMLKGNFKPSGKIYASYPSGLQTYVNYNATGNWTVNVDGEEYIIPPYGHVAIVPDELLQYTAIKDGHTVSYSRGKYYTYLDGNGETTAFPEMTCAYTYVLRNVKGKMRLTPAPFIKEETIKGLYYTKATPLKQNGSKLGATFDLDVTDIGMGDLVINKKAFHYTME